MRHEDRLAEGPRLSRLDAEVGAALQVVPHDCEGREWSRRRQSGGVEMTRMAADAPGVETRELFRGRDLRPADDCAADRVERDARQDIRRGRGRRVLVERVE